MTSLDRRKTGLYAACKALGIKKWAGFAMNCKLGLKRCQQQQISLTVAQSKVHYKTGARGKEFLRAPEQNPAHKINICHSRPLRTSIGV